MKKICNRTRVTDPAGVWNYINLIGATVRICSMPVSNLNNLFAFDNTTLHTIEDVCFRVTTDGKTITVIRLKDLPDCLFTWKDLEVLNVIPVIDEDEDFISRAICGRGYCGQMLCGKD